MFSNTFNPFHFKAEVIAINTNTLANNSRERKNKKYFTINIDFCYNTVLLMFTTSNSK